MVDLLRRMCSKPFGETEEGQSTSEPKGPTAEVVRGGGMRSKDDCEANDTIVPMS
jgi:hypothetical protein